MTKQAFICDAVRTPIGRYGGALSSVRADDLGAVPIKALMERNPKVDWAAVDDVHLRLRQPGRRGQPQRRAHGGAARRPADRACRARRSTACAARAWTRSAPRRARSSRGEAELMIAGGVESMSRAPFVMPKAESAFSRSNAVYDTTIGWRFVNKLMKEQYGVDSMPETAENVADRLQDRARGAGPDGARVAAEGGGARRRPASSTHEIVPVTIAQKKGDPIVVAQGRASARHQPRGAGQAEGRRAARRHGDGRQRLGRQRRRVRAAARRAKRAAARHGLAPRARVVGMATAGVAPRIMGIGPAPATQKVLDADRPDARRRST